MYKKINSRNKNYHKAHRTHREGLYFHSPNAFYQTFYIEIDKQSSSISASCIGAIYLVMWLYQAAESKYVLKELNRLSISKIEFPDIPLCQTKKEKGETIAQWAKNNRDQYEEELRDLIEINLNVKAISPSDMFNFFKLKSHLFGQVFNVISKESIEEKNDQN